MGCRQRARDWWSNYFVVLPQAVRLPQKNFLLLAQCLLNRPLTPINTGSLSLRKGTPYLLEAHAQILKSVPDSRLLLTRQIGGGIIGLLKKYQNPPTKWV